MIKVAANLKSSSLLFDIYTDVVDIQLIKPDVLLLEQRDGYQVKIDLNDFNIRITVE